MRGIEVEITAPNGIKGVVVGTETQEQKVKDEVIRIKILNLMTDQGLRDISLDQVHQIHVLNAPLNSEFRKALGVLATSHDTQRKPVLLTFTGQGKRRVSVGYILEAPIWKTSYRRELPEKKPPFLQGWAIVENTTDEDWKAVNLTLISGRPISFFMDLYQSLYVPRPTVAPEIYASLKPPTYEAPVEGKEMEYKPAAARPQRMLRSAPQPAATPVPMAAAEAASAPAMANVA